MSDEMSLEERIKKSREVFNAFYSHKGKFYNKEIENLSLKERRDLVGMFYENIKGKSLSEVPLKQLVAISYNIYGISVKTVSRYGENSEEEKILFDIGKLKNMSEGYERDKLNEEIAISLESQIATIPVRRYMEAIAKLYHCNNSDKEIPF